MVKGWHQRRKFLLMKKNAVVIQAIWRGYAQRKRYLVRLYRVLWDFVGLWCVLHTVFVISLSYLVKY